MKSQIKRDILFWQEPVGNEIPGNMQSIFKGEASRTATVMVQKRSAYERLMALGAKKDMIHRLGFLYPFEKENTGRAEVLICTNSDRIEHCEELVKALPQMHFHIAALTEMSSKLTGMDVYDNVSLYPGVKTEVLDELFETCDYYFDINYESEIVSAVRKAFLHNHLVFAFQETVHKRDYVATQHIYPAKDVEKMIGDVRASIEDKTVLEEHLKWQWEAALAESADTYSALGVV